MVNDTDRDSVLPLLKKLQDSPGFQMQRVIHDWQKGIREILDEFDLTPTQFKVMVAIAKLMHESGAATQKDVTTLVRTEITQNDVAHSVWMDKMTVSGVLKTLEKKGLANRVESSLDKRAKTLVLTEDGFSLLDNAIRKTLASDEAFFPSSHDREKLAQLLNKYIHRL